ncbi:YeeE/YedE family protein [Gemmobacter denitrificans]|uniref:YeeE/YedE family protein n=1 Tax=Gemmobacter denitrificans TaxID=3123040 RepID=A0ABU8BZV7_9RHOB
MTQSIAARPTAQIIPLFAAIAGLILIALLRPGPVTLQSLGLVGLGALAGLALYHASFGFAGGWKRFILLGDGRGLRAQALLIALILPASHALIASGMAGGYVVPLGAALVLGAFLFGIGMQLAGGCGSGTLFTAGGGSSRMVLVLAAFVAGSVIGTAPGLSGAGWPSLPPVSALRSLGPLPAVLIGWAVLALIVALSLRVERARGFQPDPVQTDWRRGPWPKWGGAVMLALVAIGTFVVAGRPWGITQAFALWGAKLVQIAGVDVASWPYWQGGRAAQLVGPVLADTTTVMDLALMAGAMAAAALAGRYRPRLRMSVTEVITAILGGVLMGYGARLSSGCNIGALLGGITSGSLHGWVWGLAAFAGSASWLRFSRHMSDMRGQNAPS